MLFILLSLALLGLIGLGSLQVFQPGEQSGTTEDALSNSSAAILDDFSSDADANTEKTQTPSLASKESKKPDPESQVSKTDISESERNSADEQPDLSISGAVLDDTGNLLPGISVVARPEKGQTGTRIGARALRQQTNQLGSFTFDNLVEGEYELVVAENAQYHPANLRVRAGVANAELVLQRISSVRVHGIITDDVGNLLEGVRVRTLGSRLKALSDVYGEYEIQTGPSKAGQPPVLDFSLEGYRDARERVESALGSEATEVQLDVQLEWEPDTSKVAVYGLVFGPAGEPVGGAVVWLSSPKPDFYEKKGSRATGEYRFRDVKVGDAYTIGVERQDEYAAFKSELLSIGPGDLNFDIRLEAAGFSELSGTLTDLNGAPLGNFMLWARNTDVGRQKPMPVHTDGAGQFRLEQIPSGAIKLESRSQPWLEATGIVLKPGESRRVEVPLDWGRGWLLGQVVNDLGEPVSRAKVILQWTQAFMDVRSKSRREVMSDREGYFALSNLDADEYTVMVQATGYLSSRVQYRTGQSEQDLRVTLTRER